MAINWEWMKPRLAKVPEEIREQWMQQMGGLGKPGEQDPRTPAEIAEYLDCSVELVEIAIAADPYSDAE